MLEESGNAAMKKKLGKRKGYGGVSVEEQITGPCFFGQIFGCFSLSLCLVLAMLTCEPIALNSDLKKTSVVIQRRSRYV